MKKQSFYKTFIEKENSFRPRNKFRHDYVIKELSEIVADADLVIDSLSKTVDYTIKEKEESFSKGLYLGIFLGIIATSTIGVLCLSLYQNYFKA